MISFKGKSPKILVIGDLMIDNYLWGSSHRISPEAPVPIVNINSESSLLGGAGNVINNLVSKIKEYIIMNDMNNQVDEIGENIFIMINDGHDILETNWDDFKEVKDYLKLITNLKKRDYPSLSNKTIFKFMDLKD